VSVGNAVSGGSTSNLTQVASCQLSMATRREQWSKKEVRAVIRFLNARNVSAAEIYRQLVEVYGEEVISRQECGKVVCTLQSRTRRDNG
jgi:hypothetical protein